MAAYRKFTFKEFRVCVRAGLAFWAGYKFGERYLLGELERRNAQSLDPEAWQLGNQPSTKRYQETWSQTHGQS